MKIENLKIGLVKPYNDNAKKHTNKQIQAVAESIKRFGFVQPLVVDKDNILIIGHCRLLAAKELEMKVVPTVKAENLTEDEVKALRLADNKLNESDWDMSLALPELKLLSDDLFSLTGFDKDLLIEPDAQDDVIPENVPPRSKLGDLYELGPHRVLCGDSTQQEAVSRLMDGKKADCVVTDPPYNTGMEGKVEKARLSHMFNDNLSEKDFGNLIIKSLENCFNNSKGSCAFYVFIDWRRGGANQTIHGKSYAC